MITNADLRSLVLSEDTVVSSLAAEVIQARKDLLQDRRRCAEVAGAVSHEAGAAVREYAQDCECSYVTGEALSREPANQLPSGSWQIPRSSGSSSGRIPGR